MAKTKECWEKKKVCPFLLLENSRPLSPSQEPQTPFSSSGTLDFLSASLGIASLSKETVKVKWQALIQWDYYKETPELAPLLHVCSEERMREDKAGGTRWKK